MKLFFFIILFTTKLFSMHHGPYIKDYVAEDHINFKDLRYKDYYNKTLEEFTIKFILNKKEIGENSYYLTIISDKKSLIHTNVEYEIINNIMVVKLDKNQKDELFFTYKYDEAKIADFRSDCISSFEYNYFLRYEGILYGLAYGIIFCAFLYYIIIYYSTKMICFLYYSLMQFFVLLSLVGFMYFSYQTTSPRIIHALVDFAETLSFLFTFLFAQSILRSKEKMPYINIFLNIFILLNIIDLILICIYKYSILYLYVPFYIGFLIPALVGIIAVFKGNRNAIIYTIGWTIVCFFVYIAQKGLFTISGIYIVHIGAPLESLIFSFALGLMLRDLAKEKNEKEKLLIHQSKLASMGEMINNIAHQWRQPLTHLSFINMNLQLSLEDKIVDKNYINNKINEASYQIDFMSKTIDNFRDFYKPNKQKSIFLISEAINKAIYIMQAILEDKKIDIEFEVKKDKEINSYENEYSQVVLNLITNSKDALIINKIENPKIKVVLDIEEEKSILKVFDNAGGIDDKDFELIFDPYFTTKDKGSGIGLYMSKMIIETHFKGEIKAQNIEDGVVFLLKV